MLARFLYVALGFVSLYAVTAERSPATQKDPCYNVFCTKGRMCVVNEDRSTTCLCPESCADDNSPVCSTYLREFNNTCKLHKFACKVGIMMGIERSGNCDLEGYEWEPCPVPNLLQFHDRYLEFLRVAKAEGELPREETDGNDSALTYEDRKAIIEWEFNNQDKNKNGILDRDEINAMLIPDEDCMVGFMKSCDYDHQPGISRVEWSTCFPPIVPELHEEDVEA